METRSRRRHARAEPKTPGTSLLSPTNTKLDSFFLPRKSLRPNSAKSVPCKESLRLIRQKGHTGPKPGLTGYLGGLPVEVNRPTSPRRSAPPGASTALPRKGPCSTACRALCFPWGSN